MIATDPLSLVFLGCFVFAAVFLIVSTVAGAGHHGLDLGGHNAGVADAGHALHAGHTGVHAGAAAHAGAAPDAPHAPQNGASNGAAGGPLGALVGALEGALSVYGILTFLLVFGLLGYLLHNSANLGAVATILFALLIGAASALAVGYLITRLIRLAHSRELTVEGSRLEGRMGEVSMAIRAGGAGEVLFTGAAGSRQSLGARSYDGQPIPAGVEVVILSERDGLAIVESWDRFLASARAGEAPQLEPIEKAP